MTELLERMGKGAWGGGALLKDLRAHLRPLIDLQKENDDVYALSPALCVRGRNAERVRRSKLASTYNTFLSKVINQATKSAQGADGTLRHQRLRSLTWRQPSTRCKRGAWRWRASTRSATT